MIELAVILLIITTLLMLSIVPFWIRLKKSANKYNEHEVRMFSATMWGLLGTVVTLAIEIISRLL